MTAREEDPAHEEVTLPQDLEENGISTQPPTRSNSLSEEDVEDWKKSVFAIGRSKLTWKEERESSHSNEVIWTASPWNVICTAYVCRCTGRVGNMVVLWQRTEHLQAQDGTIYERPKLLCMLGPYWMVLLGLTIPICTLVTFWTAYSKLEQTSMVAQIIWIVSTSGLFVSLLNVAFRDPGILYRRSEIPQDDDDTSWRWNDQAYTFRPADARFDADCCLVVEKFDHT